VIKALAYKEFRETLPIAALGLATLLVVMLDAMGYSPAPDLLGRYQRSGIPFLSDMFVSRFGLVAMGLALVLGFWQSMADFWGDAQLFVLHRPVSRQSVYSVKLAVGLSVYLVCTLVPLVMYVWWAATPGTHASPFEWSMTLGVWETWLQATALYLGAFLSGLRPAAWLGTRLAPLAAAALGGVLLVWFQPSFWTQAWQLAIGNMALVAAVLHVSATRDLV
jgi:hypothetical protein